MAIYYRPNGWTVDSVRLSIDELLRIGPFDLAWKVGKYHYEENTQTDAGEDWCSGLMM